MRFEDQTLSIDTPSGSTDVCVTADALHVWWGNGIGPQDAAGLLVANAELITHLATIKREAQGRRRWGRQDLRYGCRGLS